MTYQETQSGRTTAEQEGKAAAAEAKAAARELGRAEKERAVTFLDEQKQALASRVEGVAQALHRTASDLESKEETSARLTKQLADAAERFAGSMRSAGPGDLMGRTEEMARRQPGAFFASTLTLGFLAARFLKSTQERRETSPGSEAYGTAAGRGSTHSQGGVSSYGSGTLHPARPASSGSTGSSEGAGASVRPTTPGATGGTGATTTRVSDGGTASSEGSGSSGGTGFSSTTGFRKED